ncbi:hypothetical protein LguiA_018274 [Lonicera macranthoides]
MKEAGSSGRETMVVDKERQTNLAAVNVHGYHTHNNGCNSSTVGQLSKVATVGENGHNCSMIHHHSYNGTAGEVWVQPIRNFKFENQWHFEPTCKEIVRQHWCDRIQLDVQ